MTNISTDGLQDEIRSLIADIIEIEAEKVTPGASFVEDLGMDSMMALEILASLEKRYRVKIPEDNLAKIANLTQVVSLVTELTVSK